MSWVFLGLVVVTIYLLRHDIADCADIPRHLARCPKCSTSFECEGPMTDLDVEETLAEIRSL